MYTFRVLKWVEARYAICPLILELLQLISGFENKQQDNYSGNAARVVQVESLFASDLADVRGAAGAGVCDGHVVGLGGAFHELDARLGVVLVDGVVDHRLQGRVSRWKNITVL